MNFKNLIIGIIFIISLTLFIIDTGYLLIGASLTIFGSISFFINLIVMIATISYIEEYMEANNE